MTPRLFLALLLLGSHTITASAQATALDLVPAKATLAIVIRHPEELRKKGDELLNATNLNIGLRPTQALDMLKMFLGINQGLDLERPSGVVLLRSENAPDKGGFEDLERNLYVALAYTDLDKMTANFGFAAGEVKQGVIAKINRDNQPFGQYVLVRNKHLYLGISEAPLQRLLKATPLAAELTPAQRRVFESGDLLVHVNPKGLGPEWKELVRLVEAERNRVQDTEEKQSLEQLLNALDGLRWGLVGVRVEKGLGINFLTTFAKDREATRKFLDNLRTRGAADLKGLPEGKVIAAQAYAGDSTKNAALARALFNFLLKDILEKQHFTSATDRPSFVGVFNEVWQRLESSRVGVYLTRDESKLGLFSVIAILDTPDAAQFVGDMRTLAKIADGSVDLAKKASSPEVDMAQLIKDLSSAKYQVRASATTRLRLIGEPATSYLERAVANPPDLETSRRAQLLLREISAVAAERRKELLAKNLPRYIRPAFTFAAKAEERAGLSVDIVNLKLVGKDEAAERQMQQLFGPDWDKMRLAVQGKKVVVLFGSEVELFETALANVKAGRPGLAASKLMEDFARIEAPGPTATFHVCVESVLGLVNGRPRRLKDMGLTSFGLGAQDTGLQLDIFLPVSDIAAIVKERMP
jgi:hypothetical protein